MLKEDKKSIKQTFNFASKSGYDDISKWILWIGLLLAVIAGAIGYLTGIVIGFLVIFGIVIGLLRIKDEKEFLIGGLSFVILVSFAKDIYIITIIGNIVKGLLALVSPAVVVVALKKIYMSMKR